MKLSSRPPRTPSKLSDSVHPQLNMYSLAASAAGVGVLALAQPAEAKIIYTKTNHVIANHGVYNLDLNHDGITDFSLVNSYTCNTQTCFDVLNAKPMAGNGVEGKASGAYALNPGAQVGPTRPFAGELMAKRRCFSATSCLTITSAGPWINVTSKYLGLKFQIHGKTHYGWARLSVRNVQGVGMTATLTGYAYETIPNKPIITGKTKGPDDAEPAASLSPHNPEPAMLGVLAMGASGLSIWKREDPAGVTPERN